MKNLCVKLASLIPKEHYSTVSTWWLLLLITMRFCSGTRRRIFLLFILKCNCCG
jgi:hypothetical protein